MQDAAALLRGSGVESLWSGWKMNMTSYPLALIINCFATMILAASGASVINQSGESPTDPAISVSMFVFVSSMIFCITCTWHVSKWFQDRKEHEQKKFDDLQHQITNLINQIDRLNGK
jgi:predicted membrane channel-forming protein YqfA (hemolysin III family)